MSGAPSFSGLATTVNQPAGTGTNAPFNGVYVTNANAGDSYTITVASGTLYLNGVSVGSSYTGTVGDGVFGLGAPVGSSTLSLAANSATKITFSVTDPTNGFGSSAEFTVNCFVAGTMIACPGGDRAVESLKAGDLVLTASGASSPVQFLGSRILDLAAAPTHRPVLIPAGALADGVPMRDLKLSPDHAIVFNGVLVPARNLVGGAIRQLDMDVVTYYHIQLARHDVVIAEGTPCETLLDTDDHSTFDNAAEGVVTDAFLAPCLPRVTQGPALEAILALIHGRVTATV